MKKWFKPLSSALFAIFLLAGMAGCNETSVRSSSYGSSNYQPYDYYYYPESRIYLNVSTGYYFYPYKNNWRKVRSLPRSYHLNQRDRVTIRIKSKDRPYSRNRDHRTKYAPRRYNRDNYRNQQYNRDRNKDKYRNQQYNRDKNKNKNRTKVRVKKTYDYYYYPSSRVYYNAKSKYYYYPGRKKWNRTKRVPSNYRLKQKERVKVRVKSRDKPYLNHEVHRARYIPRKNYNKNKVKTRVNILNNRKVQDYEKGGK